MEIYHGNRRASFAHPTNDGLFAVFMAFPIAMFKQVRLEIEQHFMAAADAFPTLGERLRGKREEPFYGAADLSNIRRRPLSIADHRENLAAQLEEPPANVLTLRAALKYDPVNATRSFQARVGLIPHDAFFNPETLSRLMTKPQ